MTVEVKSCENCAYMSRCSKQYKEGGCGGEDGMKNWKSSAPAIIEDIERKIGFRLPTEVPCDE